MWSDAEEGNTNLEGFEKMQRGDKEEGNKDKFKLSHGKSEK